jgi:preprotein translocase subunit YajC
LIGSVTANSLVLAADSGAGGGIFQFLILFAPLFLIWYFLVILPQQRQRRKTQEMLANLKTGDRVLTSGGILGTVMGFRDDVVQLQVAKQVQLDVARNAITALQGAEGAEKKQSGSKGKK